MVRYLFGLKVSRVLFRLGLFALCFSTALFFLYLLGSYQEFLDATQESLLGWLGASLLAGIAASGAAAIALIVTARRVHEFPIGRFLVALALLALQLALLYALKFLTVWLRF